MRFSLFGIPTQVEFSFWFGTVLLGMPYLQAEFKPLILVWVAVVFLSVLAHELGHALSVRAFGLHPEIRLHWVGGLTSWTGGRDLSRPKRVFISFAGPLAGFVIAGLAWLAMRAYPELGMASSAPLAMARSWALRFLVWVNFFWGIVNLAPVLPLDGGHILEHALGPKRGRTTAAVSMTFGTAIAVWAFLSGMQWMGFLFAMCAIQSFQRYQAEPAIHAANAARTEARVVEPPLSPEVERELKRASDALADDRFSEARHLAESVLAKEPPRAGRIRSLEIVAWSHLLEGSLEDATRTVRAIERHGKSDAALAGGVLFARGDLGAARAVFEAARSVGDDRKEVVGPLIQILISEGAIARAAATALDIVDTLSDDDARRMAELAAEAREFTWSARLHEALFERAGEPGEAFAVARARALGGDLPGALSWLEKAAASGFDDGARVWRDEAFAALRTSSADALTRLFPTSGGPTGS